jgi:hypothetical protein
VTIRRLTPTRKRSGSGSVEPMLGSHGGKTSSSVFVEWGFGPRPRISSSVVASASRPEMPMRQARNAAAAAGIRLSART